MDGWHQVMEKLVAVGRGSVRVMDRFAVRNNKLSDKRKKGKKEKRSNQPTINTHAIHLLRNGNTQQVPFSGIHRVTYTRQW